VSSFQDVGKDHGLRQGAGSAPRSKTEKEAERGRRATFVASLTPARRHYKPIFRNGYRLATDGRFYFSPSQRIFGSTFCHGCIKIGDETSIKTKSPKS
jgi:hypothetical protein